MTKRQRVPRPYTPIKFDYSKEPLAIEEITYTNPTLRFILGWLGIKKPGIRKVRLEGGELFAAYPISKGLVPEWSNIIRGATDVTGGYWAWLNDGKPCLNAHELDGPFTAREGDPMLQRIADYRKSGAPLTEDPSKWPEPYRSAWENAGG